MSNVYNPVSTYRIQFHQNFTFHDFEKIIPYLVRLGVRTIYASPVFEAGPGSLHGYDGVNPNRINPEIGTEEELVSISSQLKKNKIGWIQDIVPNHLSFHGNNDWLMDVLRKGPTSEYARYFDIDWEHPAFVGKLMVPFPGSPLDEKLKKELPGEEHYKICHWTETDKQINYRRFFTVNSLICTNIQDQVVFDSFHRLIKKLLDTDVFQGVRVDHVDGLYDPPQYLRRLRQLGGEESYIVVEKILEAGERLPEQWPIQGNSGYDFLGMVNNLLTYNGAEYALTTFYFDITADSTPVINQVHSKKSHVLFNHMNGELDNLVRLYKRSGLSDGQQKDFSLRDRIAKYLIDCPVYRYYGDDFPVMPEDEGKDMALLRPFYTRCMQFTGPLMAKGVEDTLMYTYNRFTGHNEVGDSPEFFGYTANEFHDLMIERREKWPLSLNGSSTHDTKRGEDARARLHVLTGFHEEWMSLVTGWMKKNSALKINGAPDRNDEYFIYQTLVATHPYPSKAPRDEEVGYPARIKEYLHKALREAKVHSDWSEPNEEYEDACIAFAHNLIKMDSTFRESFEPFLKKVADYGMINSFSQLALKFCCPGVPDIYQGTELWDLSLVDPDNRRPVDYRLRMEMLEQDADLSKLWHTRENGQIKLALLHLLLGLRNRFADLMASGEYIPAEVEGKYSEHVFAFFRRYQGQNILVAIPLYTAFMHFRYGPPADAPLEWDWEDTKIILPPGLEGEWEDLINGGSKSCMPDVPVDKIFGHFPVGIFYK